MTADAPELTTEAPEVTTEAPEVTTEAPEVATEAPEVTTEEPEVAATALSMTDRLPVRKQKPIKKVKVRKDFPETWLWRDVKLK